MSKPFNDTALSEDTKGLVEVFDKKQSHYNTLFSHFQEENQDQLMQLDTAREDMNASLDEAKRAIRADAVSADYLKIKKISYGQFKVQKKWSSHYIVEMFTDIMQDLGLVDAAVEEGVIAVKTEVNAALATEFLRKNSIEDRFKVCLDGKELTPSVTCPKPVAPFGGSLK